MVVARREPRPRVQTHTGVGVGHEAGEEVRVVQGRPHECRLR